MAKRTTYAPGRDPQKGTVVQTTRKKNRPRKPGPPADPDAVFPRYMQAYEFYLSNPGSSQEAVARAIGIDPRTMRDWWSRPGFRRGLKKQLDLAANELAVRIAHRLASKAEQVGELGRLYDITPDSYVASILTYKQGLNADGQIAGQNEAVSSYQERQIPVQRSNAPAKAQIIRQIHDIVNPLLELHVHLPGMQEIEPLSAEGAAELEARQAKFREVEKLALAEEAEFEVEAP